MITRADDGSVEATELRDADDSEVGELRALERDLAILLAEEDIEEIGASLDPGSAAAVLVWENTWAAPFGSAVRRSGGELLGSGRIPTQALIAAVAGGPRSRNERSMKMGPFRDRGRPTPPYLGGHERVRRHDRRGDRRDDRRDRPRGPTGRPPRPASRTRAAAAIALRRDEHVILPRRDGRAAAQAHEHRRSGAI